MADPSAVIQMLETWSFQVSTILGAFTSLFGLFALSAAGFSCKIAGMLQILAGLIIVAIEGPNFLPQLSFAAPAGAILEGKSAWTKVALYAALTIVPAFAGCFKAFLLGFIASLAVTIIQGFLVFSGSRTVSDEMSFPGDAQQDGGRPAGQAYSPTTP